MHIRNGPPIIYLCEHNTDGTPKFMQAFYLSPKNVYIITTVIHMYCVNARVAYQTEEADVVLFNEAMASPLNVSCEEMITTYGYSDPKPRPDNMLEVTAKPKIMTLTIRPDHTIAVNDVFEPERLPLLENTTTTILALPPVTPAKHHTTQPTGRKNKSMFKDNNPAAVKRNTNLCK